ncbi:MAG: ArnT family glycosyltransferase [Acidiferrobacterales bacterium]
MNNESTGMSLDRRTFLILLGVITIIRFAFMASFPIKNDEAMFVLWAQHLDSGYFDHPPFIAWLIWFMSLFSTSIVWYRMAALVAGLVATWGVYYFASLNWGKESGRFAALLFALSPSSLWLVVISNDVPLLVFLVLSAVTFHKAIAESRYSYSLLSGVLLGLAFLSKYFAVITGVGFLIYALLENRKQRLTHLAIVVAAVIPFALQHIYYNYHNCWATVNFLFFVRNANSNLGIGNLFAYLFEVLLVLTPWGLIALYRNRNRLAKWSDNLPLVLAVTGVVAFGLMAFRTIIGLHFLLVFSPFAFALFGILIKLKSARKIYIASLVYGVVLVLVLTTLLFLPLKKLEGWKQHANFVVGLAPSKVCSHLDKYEGLPLFTNYYAYSGILGYTCQRDIQVLFGDSRYGRQMDDWLDVHKLEGKEVVILDVDRPLTDKYRKYFDSYRTEQFRVYGAPFYVFIGKGFNYNKYRDTVLRSIRDRYYSPPAWLPEGGCSFTERYFGQDATR